MSVLDIIILVILIVGLVRGLMSGFFRQVVSMVGFLIGLLVACMLYLFLADWLAPYIGGDQSVSRIVAFILIWVCVPLALTFVAYLLTKMMEAVQLGGLNRLAGGLIAMLKYALLLSCLLSVCNRIRLIPDAMKNESYMYAPVQGMSEWLFDMCEPHVTRFVEEKIQEIRVSKD